MCAETPMFLWFAILLISSGLSSGVTGALLTTTFDFVAVAVAAEAYRTENFPKPFRRTEVLILTPRTLGHSPRKQSSDSPIPAFIATLNRGGWSKVTFLSLLNKYPPVIANWMFQHRSPPSKVLRRRYEALWASIPSANDSDRGSLSKRS